MFNPADQRSPLLFLKSKIANQPGYVLIGHPARWQKVGPDYAGTDHHHAIYKKGEIKSLEKLQKNPEFAKLPKEDQIKAVQDDAKATQDKNTASSKASTFIQKVSSGKVPQASEWKHWLEQSRDKKSADIAKFTADPQTKAFWEMAIANYRAKAMANIERHKAEETQSAPTETVSGDKISKEKIAEKVALTSGDKFDHGELNVPGKSNKIDAELDKEKAKQAKQDKADAKTAIADKKTKKAKAKELFAQYGQEMIDQYSEKLGKKEVASTLDQMVKWEPTKFIAMVEKYQKEKAEKADKKADKPEPVKAEETRQAKAPETDKKADIEAEKKPDEPTDGTDYDAKIQEYATGATYKQKAYKILSKDPDWQALNSKDKFETLHDWYLMEQEKANLSGAIAKFKAALLSGKAPTKALVEKFNSLNKDDQAKVLKPVLEKMDKAEIGKLLEQSGAKPQDTGSASPIKHTFSSKKDKTEANVADNGKGGWAVSLKDTESGSTFPTVEIFNSEDEAIAHAKALVGLKDEGPKEPESAKNLSKKALEAMAYELGKKSDVGFSPLADPEMLHLMSQHDFAEVGSAEFLLQAWVNGKTEAHLAAPVPGWTEEENTRFKGQAESSGAEKPTDEVGHGSAWVAALASGKKPDADLDNKIVMMPEDRQQELFSKAALLWSKKQGLESDENAIGLSKQVLSDIMNNVELHEGDTKTINGVTYVLEGGRWHRANKPSTVGPAQKLEAMQMLGSSDLMDEIDAGKISAKTDKLLDVMGPDAKAAFYNWVSAYKNYGFSIYRKAAVCAAYGHPNEVLLKDGSWRQFDPGMVNSHLAVPSDIHQKAVEEATIAAQNEPSSGPQNPDTPQSFGHGTVTFTGPAKLHDLLSQKGWVTGDGPDFKQKFLKSMHDWSISQSKDDHGDWKQTVFYLHDMFPVGAMVKMDDSGKANWKVVQGDNALAFKNILTGEVQQYKKGEQVSQLVESLWHSNPTIIPPGHPDGKMIRNPVTDKLETDSPVIELPNSSTLEYKKADGIWHSRLKGVGGASWYPIGNSNVALVLVPQLDAALAKVMDEKPTTDQVADDLPVFNMELPGGTQANYKKIDGIWQTENQLGKPDMGWHPINQDGWMVPELEQKLKSAQGDNYDLNQHPQVQSYIQAVANGTTPSLDDTAFVGKNTDGESYKQVFEAASEAYAKNHGLDPSDVNDKQLADMVALDLLLKNEHPKEGDTKVINGHTYQLINGRWHRMDKEQDQGFVTGLPHYENTKFKKEGDGWVFMASNGEWSPVGISVAEKLDEYQKNNPSPVTDVLKSPFDAIKTPHQAIDDSVLSATQKEKLKDQLDALKASAQQDGIAAFKGVLKYMSKSGKTIVKIPNGYKITIHDNKDWNKPWANDLLQYVNDLKAATELASGKKPKKTAPKKTSNAPDPIQPAAISSKTVMVGNAKARLIDDWEQTGPQGGSNPGGQFTDKSGKQWYCKFPGDPEVSKNEFLATKFYQMLGVSVPDMMLVQKDGKLGVATKWVDGLTKGSAKELAKAQGAHEAFAIDAWLANWDVIGLANDNLLLDKDGKALRADAGGALIFRAQGGAKGDAFGDEVSELDTLTDPTKNAQAAAVFGDISSEKMAWGLGQLNKIKPSQIEELVDAIGPGTAEEKKALAKKLIARRANILQKFNIRDQWDKKPPDITKLPVDPKDLPDAIDFNNFEGKGKPLSSVPDINDANTAASQALINFAAQGNLEALKTYQFDEYDKNTKSYTGKKIPIENHPSKHIQEQWAGLVQTLQSIAYPPADTLDMPPLGSGETPEEIAKEVGSFAPDKNISNISPEHVLGYFMKLGQVSQDVVESLKNAVDWKWTSPGKSPGYFQMLKGVYSKARQSVKEYISGVQSSGYVNHIWSQGKKEWQGHTINQLTADIYADAVEVDEGTQMWRWMDDDTAGKMMTKQFLSSHPGDILQNTDSMCTSFHEHWNESTHFVKDSSKALLMRIRCVKGVKMSPTYATGSLAGEGEFTTLPGQRFIVIGIQKGGKLHPDGVFLDVIALPPDDGFVAQLGAATKS